MSFPHVYNPIPREALLSSRHFASVEEAISGFNKPETVIHRILDAAAVPSFSSFEETLHPWVVKTLDCVPDVTITRVPHASLLVRRASKKGLPIVVLSAHLDKIDHFDGQNPKVLRSFEWKEEIEGLLDDATGLGIVLSLFLEMADVPVDLVLALSELEEGTGLRFHPERMRMGGSGLKHGQGARELGKKLLAARKKPAGFVTIDTTPFFRGKPGVAVYANHWELNEMTPAPEMVSATQSLVSRLLEKNPLLQVLNNTNDYLEYGRLLVKKNHPVPCVALEPAIYPYHQADERVFKADIERIYTLAREAVVALGAIS
jgi:hypothetical protein